jgi:hypothetical protein
MNNSILDYMETDKFLYLFTTSERYKIASKHTSVITVHRRDFGYDIIDMFDDDLGVPDWISCVGSTDNIVDGHFTNSEKGNSFSCDSITLNWRRNSQVHRDYGPATIIFNDFETMHTDGRRTGFTLHSWSARWYQNGIAKRAFGPHVIHGEKIENLVDKTGASRTVETVTIVSDWKHPSDESNINPKQITETLNYHGIKINEFSRTNSVFSNSLDEIAFYSSI